MNTCLVGGWELQRFHRGGLITSRAWFSQVARKKGKDIPYKKSVWEQRNASVKPTRCLGREGACYVVQLSESREGMRAGRQEKRTGRGAR